MIGRNIGNYQVTAELAHGSLGPVYLGRHLQQSTEVVIKEIPLGAYPLSARVQLKARFRRAAFIQSQLSHPGIVRLYESLSRGENIYLVMEYVLGMNLRELLYRQGLPTPPQALFLCKQALVTLDFAHNFRYLDESDMPRLGVIHRDLKPSNLILETSGKLRVTDFGIANLPDSPSYSYTGFSPGTLEYMPPEQLRGLELDARSDIYGLGVTIYEMLTGHHPYLRRGNGAQGEVTRLSFESMPPALNDVRSDIEPALSSILMKALSRHPNERYSTAEEFLQAIKEYEKKRNLAESPVRPQMKKTGRLSKNEPAREEKVNPASEPVKPPAPSPPTSAPSRESAVMARTPAPLDPGNRSGSLPYSAGAAASEPSRSRRRVTVPMPSVSDVYLHQGDEASLWQEQAAAKEASRGKERSSQLAVIGIAAAILVVAFSVGAYFITQRIRPSERPAEAPVTATAATTTMVTSPEAGHDAPATSAPAPPENATALAKLDAAREADKQGKFNQAVALYEEYLRLGAGAPETETVSAQVEKLKKFIGHLNAAKVALDRQDFQAARNNYAEALKLRPYSKMVQNGLAAANAKLSGQSGTANPSVEKVPPSSPPNELESAPSTGDSPHHP